MEKKILSLLLIMASMMVQGQSIDRVYRDAQAKFLDEDLINARELYKTVIAEQPTFKDAKYRLEICELLTDQRNRPIDNFLSFAETNGKTDKFYNFWLGQIYADKYAFRKAIVTWNKFLSDGNPKSPEIEKDVAKFIEESEALILAFDNPGDYEIHQLESEVNTIADEITPVFFEKRKELIYASSRESEDLTRPDFSIYHNIHEDLLWTQPVIVEELGHFEEDEANFGLINQNGKLFEYRPDRGGTLYYSESIGDGWSTAKELDQSLSQAQIRSHFTISEKEDRIIFATDEDFKVAGMELYQSTKNPANGKWSKPGLLAANLSSSWDEDTPYLSPDGKSIYFSSNRPGGLGGYDIYVSHLNESSNQWSEPENLGFPINTPDDELHFKMNSDQKSGYFSSKRYRSKGRFDIYFFWEIKKINLAGRIMDLSTGKPATDVSISFRPSQYEDQYFRSEVDTEGRYATRIISEETFKVEIERDGEIIYTDSYEAADNLSITYNQDFSIGKAPQVILTEKIPKEVTLEEKIMTRKRAILRNIYFDHGTSQLKKSSNPVLEALLKTMNGSNLRIEVAGHTDNTGPASVNEWLSQRRAEAIQKWLVRNGIPASRITPKGYGESNPMASNDDETDGRELNRRIEIVVIP